MTSNKLDEEFITKAIQTVEENISDEDFTADDLAEKLFMSRSSLYYKMNSISGEPPANFIRRIRFNMACKLLLDGRYSISEVSAMVGFSSRSYFSTSFKKYMGCMPSDYVKNRENSAWEALLNKIENVLIVFSTLLTVIGQTKNNRKHPFISILIS